MDRNICMVYYTCKQEMSLSARRAWIEIVPFDVIRPAIESLSARRAWIEIKMLLRDSTGRSGRSPQGERG